LIRHDADITLAAADASHCRHYIITPFFAARYAEAPADAIFGLPPDIISPALLRRHDAISAFAIDADIELIAAIAAAYAMPPPAILLPAPLSTPFYERHYAAIRHCYAEPRYAER